MIVNAWTLALLVTARGGWCAETRALLDTFTADLVAAMAHPHRPG